MVVVSNPLDPSCINLWNSTTVFKMMGEGDDAVDDAESADDETPNHYDDVNDIMEGIFSLCPRCVWLVLGGNHEIDPSGQDSCWRPDLCVSFFT